MRPTLHILGIKTLLGILLGCLFYFVNCKILNFGDQVCLFVCLLLLTLWVSDLETHYQIPDKVYSSVFVEEFYTLPLLA